MIDPKVKAAMVEAAMKSLYYDQSTRGSRLTFGQLCQHNAELSVTAAMLAAEAQGYKLVGPEATEEMVAVIWDSYWDGSGAGKDTWRAGHAAAPGWEDGE